MDESLSIFASVESKSDRVKEQFKRYIENDFNMPKYLKLIFEGLTYLGIFLLIAISYFIVRHPSQIYIDFNNRLNGAVYHAIPITFIAIDVIYILIQTYRKKLSFKTLLISILIIGLLTRLSYLYATQYDVRQNDTISINNDAHYDYALSFFLTGKLPNHHIHMDDIYQFYHPPLNAFICGMWMRIVEPFYLGIYNVTDPHIYFQSCGVIMTFCTFMTSIVIIKAIKLMNPSRNTFFLGAIFAMFFPRFIQFSMQLNNDTITLFFSTLACYFTLKWFIRQKDKNIFESKAEIAYDWLYILLSALFIGLAMMTKLAAATICLGIGFCMAWAFIRKCIKKEKKAIINMVGEFVVFLAICAPLGLWHQVYMHENYGMPYLYVFDRLNSDLSVSDVNPFFRFFIPISFHDIGNGLFASAFNDYNIFTYAVKTALYGEFTYNVGGQMSFLLFVSAYLIIIFSLVNGIYRYVKTKHMNGYFELFSISLFIGIIIMFLYSNISMPYGCTMDFRYIPTIVFPFTMTLCYNQEYMSSVNKEDRSLILNILNCGNTISVYTFAISSILFYLICY